MKCPNCGAEVRAEDKFCGECGKPLRREIEIAPVWKWGSMIASLVLLFWLFLMFPYSYREEVLLISLIFGFLATIYLMYKERTEKIKYGLVWILFPILIFLLFSPEYGDWLFMLFLWFAIPAIAIDVIYVYKIEWKWGSMIASLVLIFIFWSICFSNRGWTDKYTLLDMHYDTTYIILLLLLIFGLPATTYLMHKERTEKIKYGLAWILFPILLLLFALKEYTIQAFLLLAIPAIVIDAIYVYKTR